MEISFCRRCGSRLVKVDVDAYKCSNDHMQFNSPAPTASVVLVDGDYLVMSRRAIEPAKGLVDFFGGFLMPGETFYEGAVRELQEELSVDKSSYSELEYLGSYASDYHYQEENRPVVCVYFIANLLPGSELRAADDSADIVRLAFKEDIDWTIFSGDEVRAVLKDVLKLLQK